MLIPTRRIYEMNHMKVYRQSVFPAHIDTIFRLLKDLKTLQYIAKPYASFEPLDGNGHMVWEEGQTISFRFRIFCLIPFGIHTIHVLRFSKDGIFTKESNTHVPVWNHRIEIKALSDGRTSYTDEVEIGAGWKTLFVYGWATCFYAHRQKKWIRLLRERMN